MGNKSEVLFEYPRITPDTNLDDLGTFQKMIAVIARRNEKSGYNEINRIRAEKKYYAKHNELREDLRSFLDKALAPLAYGGERAVTVAIDSAFLPVLTKVLNLPVYAKNYTCVALKHPRIERNIKHMLEFLFLAKRGA